MNKSPRYVLDSDVFIAAKNSYYAFMICPGFWKSLIGSFNAGRICSIDRVRNELLAGNETEDLYEWVKITLPKEFFVDTFNQAVSQTFSEIMLWVQRNPQFTDQAKAKFATEADGWLVAFAKTNGSIVITNEQPRPDSRNRILLPDVCTQFNVLYNNTFSMLRDMSIQYDWMK